MSVISVGLDLVSIPRIARAIHDKGDRILQRLLTEIERSYCKGQAYPARHVAARLAAKEAAWKAFQAAEGTRSVGWRDVEVIRDPDGRPELRFHGRAVDAVARLHVRRVLLSISHTDETAAAVVVLTND